MMYKYTNKNKNKIYIYTYIPVKHFMSPGRTLNVLGRPLGPVKCLSGYVYIC